MTEFHAEIRHQVARAAGALRAATAAGDDYLVEVSQAELANLARTADEHGLRVPELDSYRAA